MLQHIYFKIKPHASQVEEIIRIDTQPDKVEEESSSESKNEVALTEIAKLVYPLIQCDGVTSDNILSCSPSSNQYEQYNSSNIKESLIAERHSGVYIRRPNDNTAKSPPSTKLGTKGNLTAQARIKRVTSAYQGNRIKPQSKLPLKEYQAPIKQTTNGQAQRLKSTQLVLESNIIRKQQQQRASELINLYGGVKHQNGALFSGRVDTQQPYMSKRVSNLGYNASKPYTTTVLIVEDRPNFQSLSDITKADEIRRANGSSSAMSSFYKKRPMSNEKTNRIFPQIQKAVHSSQYKQTIGSNKTKRSIQTLQVQQHQSFATINAASRGTR